MGDADRLADLTVFSAQGGRFRLGDLWKEKPAVVVFVRHFG